MYSKRAAAREMRQRPFRKFSVHPCVSSGLAGGDEAHLVDLVGVAATGQVIDGSVQALQDLSLIHIDVYKRQMLDAAMTGSFSENNFDESQLSALETKFAHYLSAAEASSQNIAQEKDK